MTYINESQKAWKKSQKEIEENWELAFGKKDKPKKEENKDESLPRTSRS